MTIPELIEQLRQIADKYRGDPEAAYSKADELLLKFIDNADVDAAYDEIDGRYSTLDEINDRYDKSK